MAASILFTQKLTNAITVQETVIKNNGPCHILNYPTCNCTLQNIKTIWHFYERYWVHNDAHIYDLLHCNNKKMLTATDIAGCAVVPALC